MLRAVSARLPQFYLIDSTFNLSTLATLYSPAKAPRPSAILARVLLCPVRLWNAEKGL